MKNFWLGQNVTVFLLFFGVALLEAIQSRNWIKMVFWLAIGTVFLRADRVGRRDPRHRKPRFDAGAS
jgi:hypothetical protein